MTMWQTGGGLAALYLVLLARSAWKQGELRQFAWSLLVVAALLGALALAVWTAMKLDGAA